MLLVLGALLWLSSPYVCLCWRCAYCPIPSWQVSSSGSPSVTEPASDPHKQDFVVPVFQQASGQQTSGTTLDEVRHVTGLYAGSCHMTGPYAGSFLRRAFCVTQGHSAPGGERVVSTQHPQCALSQPPAGGGCDGDLGGVGGSGGTCGSAGLQSEAGCPGPSRHHGSLRPPQLTKGHCCMEGSHCLPVGSWCCTHDHFQFPSGPSSVASFLDCVRVAP